MNKFKIGLLLFIPLMFSCKKVLDTAPYASVTDANAFSTAARCALVLNGVYDAAQGDFYVTGTTENRGYPFGAASISQSDARGEDLINVQAFLQVTYQATYNATNANSAAMWKGLYELINKCNIAIAGFRKAAVNGVLPTATANQYEGECRLLRAMAHHEAVLHWAKPYLDGAGSSLGVPYRDFPITDIASANLILTIPRPKVSEDYTKILVDLDSAENNLPSLSTTAPNFISYRATKAAAIALKMRVKLHKGDWAGVIAEGNKLIPAVVTPNTPSSTISPIGGWALTAVPDGPFANNNSSESIFSIKNDPVDAPSTNGALSRLLGSASLGGRGLVSLSPVIYNNPGWLCDDKRRSSLTISGVNSTNSATLLSIFTTKYRDYSTFGDYAPMIRYAEVLLTQAEAEARNNAGVSSRAVDLLNVVRNRSLANPLTQQYTVASFADQVTLVKAILLERRIELLAEGRRWGDISRLVTDANYTTGGIPAKALNGTAGLANFVCGTPYTPGQTAIAYSNFLFLWPIPITEIQTNPIIVQNPGY